MAIAFTTTDVLSGVASTSHPSPLMLTAEGETVSDQIVVTDRAGNSATFTSPSVRIDKTPPVVTSGRSPAANGFGWNNGAVTAEFSATDALSTSTATRRGRRSSPPKARGNRARAPSPIAPATAPSPRSPTSTST